MFDGLKSFMGAVGQRIESIKEKSTQSLETIKQDSSKVVTSVNKNLQDLAAVSKDSIGVRLASNPRNSAILDHFLQSNGSFQCFIQYPTIGGKIRPFSSSLDDRLGHHKDISFDAGVEIVDGYGHAIAVVRHNNLVVAEKSRLTYRTLLACAKHCSSLDSQWKEMNTAMKILPELTESVVTIQERVQGLCASIAKIEAALTQLNEDTVSHQISGWKKEQIAVADAYQRKKEDELRELELKLKKSREVVVDERMQKVLSRSISIEIEAEKEKDRVRAELDQQIQQSMHEYLIYGGFGSTTKSPSSEDDAHAQLKTIAPPLPSSELEEFLGPDEDTKSASAEETASLAESTTSSEAPVDHIHIITEDEEPSSS